MITFARLQGFRSYDDASFEFEPGVNIIVGPNASGKTTLIEGITVACNGKSFKAKDYELLQASKEWARIDIGAVEGTRTVKLVKTSTGTNKTFDIHGKEYTRLSMQKIIPSVVFEPNHLLLLHRSPELRRNFFDDLIRQLVPGYDTNLRHYKRVLAQRNSLLKQSHANHDQLFVWNLRLSELGGRIVTERLKLIEQFNKSLTRLYSEISGSASTVTLKYETNLKTNNYETNLLHALERSTEKDISRGFTSHGPHREDVSIFLNKKLASETASRGEVRTLVLALKMLEAEFIEKARDTRPLLLLDDVFSELDGKRRQALVQFLTPYQSFITTTDADMVIEHLLSQQHNIIATT